MRRLKRRNGMLVDELDLPTALEHQAELVEAGHRPLQHHAVDQKQGHAFRLAGRRGEEQVLQGRLRCFARRAVVGTKSGGVSAGMMVEIECL